MLEKVTVGRDLVEEYFSVNNPHTEGFPRYGNLGDDPVSFIPNAGPIKTYIKEIEIMSEKITKNTEVVMLAHDVCQYDKSGNLVHRYFKLAGNKYRPIDKRGWVL